MNRSKHIYDKQIITQNYLTQNPIDLKQQLKAIKIKISSKIKKYISVSHMDNTSVSHVIYDNSLELINKLNEPDIC